MIVADQAEVLAFLSRPDSYPDAGSVNRIDTHAAVVFLAGNRAYKLKRAVRYDYLDYSTIDLRKATCQREVEINRKTAPGLYLGAEPVSRQADGTLAIGGQGTPVDWLVVMRRFDQADLLDRMAETGRLPLSLMPSLAENVAALHEQAAKTPRYGGHGGMVEIIDGNAEAFAAYDDSLPPDRADGVTRRCRETTDENARLLDARRDGGLVRRCHGDLHLRNIVMCEGRPTPFDAIEFNDAIACGDVLYDLAFLLMDLWHRQMPAHANALFNAYLLRTGDDGGLPLLPLFLGCRAAIRAKTTASAASLEQSGAARERLGREARAYLDLAAALLDPHPPVLVAVGGLSGSGKSTLAARLAPRLGRPPGAVIARSDLVRKALFHQRAETPLGPDAYAPPVNRTVYDQLADRAARVLPTGQSVVLDAVFADAEERTRAEQVARDAGVPFAGLWLDASESTLVERVAARKDDASDATPEVVRAQVSRRIEPVGWRRIDASGLPEQTLDRAEEVLNAARAIRADAVPRETHEG
jgi:aminoglycoside phosphotransferase family enzyme/predicted kinase